MFIIGIDPHKGSHTAVAVDRSETVVDTIRVDADRHQRSRLVRHDRVKIVRLGRSPMAFQNPHRVSRRH